MAGVKGRTERRPKSEPQACRTERKPVILEETDSTNRWLKEALSGGAPDGTVVIAKRQTAGRGRFDRSFSSPKGGLYYSYLKKNFPGGENLVIITQLVAVAVRRAIIESTGIALDIKWINDLYAEGRKICGILCESQSKGPENHVIVGIGINVNTKTSDLPGELREKAGSLAEIKGESLDIEALAAALTFQLDKLFSSQEELETEYFGEYRKYCFNYPEDNIIKQEE